VGATDNYLMKIGFQQRSGGLYYRRGGDWDRDDGYRGGWGRHDWMVVIGMADAGASGKRWRRSRLSWPEEAHTAANDDWTLVNADGLP
jgi:hypothetical protein